MRLSRQSYFLNIYPRLVDCCFGVYSPPLDLDALDTFGQLGEDLDEDVIAHFDESEEVVNDPAGSVERDNEVNVEDLDACSFDL